MLRLAFLICLCIGQLCAASNPGTAPDINNFHQVNDHVFRGAQPSPLGLEQVGALGIKRVIDLREPGSSTAFEQKQLKKLGISYINIPFRHFSAPSDDQIEAVLKLLASAETPTFIHCRRGKDRTGTAIACYRIQHDGWENERALREAKSYGMSSFERAMQQYILHFTPRVTPQLLPVRPH
ncbi:MAG: fused DSP-PTPase phosphatase/NAD kinase-like protein [Bryobacteraceae bacterium]